MIYDFFVFLWKVVWYGRCWPVWQCIWNVEFLLLWFFYRKAASGEIDTLFFLAITVKLSFRWYNWWSRNTRTEIAFRKMFSGSQLWSLVVLGFTYPESIGERISFNLRPEALKYAHCRLVRNQWEMNSILTELDALSCSTVPCSKDKIERWVLGLGMGKDNDHQIDGTGLHSD